MHDLDGKRIVITGASQGIGQAAAIAAAQAGAHVAFTYRSATAEAGRPAAGGRSPSGGRAGGGGGAGGARPPPRPRGRRPPGRYR
jgi:3-oxoacyl-[acyl-carrier protein] reductase